jgi:hypothetical protein
MPVLMRLQSSPCVVLHAIDQDPFYYSRTLSLQDS